MNLGIFRCAGTARNCVGVIRWACNSFQLGRSWDSDLISQTLHGLDKKVIRLLGPVKHQRTLLTQLLVTQVASVGMQMVSEEFTVATLIFWEFLLRVQSEGVPMQVCGDGSKLCWCHSVGLQFFSNWDGHGTLNLSPKPYMDWIRR